MNIRSVYVYVDGGKKSAGTVRSACQIAESFSASITGFMVVPDPTVISAEPEAALMSPKLVEEIQKSSERQVSAAENIFHAEAGNFDIERDWIEIEASLEGVRAAIAGVALYADLIVVGQYDSAAPAETDPALPQDMVVDSGRPICLIPNSRQSATFGSNILIGWNESREVARAVFDAMPFLSRADKVTVVTIVSDRDESVPEAGKIEQLLSRQGIDATVKKVARKDDESTSEALFRQAEESGADMLVAGAYGHFRLREDLFGGVSKSIFDETTLPTLMSH